MDINGCTFSKLPFSSLFQTYISNFSKLSSLYTYNPLRDADIEKRSKQLKGGTHRTDYITALKDYHTSLGIEEEQDAPLQKLRQDNVLTVVTGQQLGVYGGPLFTVYKTATAILLARKWEEKLNRPVVPVFWMADEDHDFDEIAWTGILGRKDFHKIKLDKEGNNFAVADQLINAEFLSFKEKVKEELFDTDFTEALWSQLQGYYKEGHTHGQAFARLINHWFAKEGVLIAGSNYPAVKELLKAELKHSIEEADPIHQAIEKQSTEVDEGYHQQVTNGDTNLFYVSKEQGRVKIQKDGSGWKAADTNWNHEQLLQAIEDQPHAFSPNVFMRPILQDKLLPTLGYVAGPGEIAYYAQMKKLYHEFDLEMPVIFPRLSITLIESGISRITEKLPFDFSDYSKRIEDLEKEFVEQADTPDLEAVFGKWKQDIQSTTERPSKVINEIDPTLDGTVGKTIAGFSNELDKLKGKVYRSIKQQEVTQIKRIEKIKVNLFPDGGLQERSVSPVYFMNKYGLDIWSKLIDELEEQELDLSTHHLIHL
ncbi:MAG: bacillithiol biosynthesis cysteine-adding enzyme BshC [Balneolaceae bacterium]|nr:bacillithiol biosynthesis cysteine-adding enzyme BshC [Balneolaceae bacterium]